MPNAEVDGVSVYYEQRGTGPIVLLLHGAAMVAEGWAAQLAGLSGAYTVIAPERRGVGRTPDDARPWSYEGMADETAAFMDAMGITSADVVGLSDGGNIGLILAHRRPDLVRSLAVSGANASPEGLGEFADAVESMSATELLDDAPPQVQGWIAIHRQVAPDGGASLVHSFEKMQRMWLDFEITPDQLGQITAPTMVMAGDRDIIPVEHTVEIWGRIPNADLCIVPRADHFWMQDVPDLANKVLHRFLSQA